MKYPTKVRYGLRLLLRLGMQEGDQVISLSEVAQDENISVKYLEQIITRLKPLGVIESSRGYRGGYRLTVSPDKIIIENVFACLGGLEPAAPCLPRQSRCGAAKTNLKACRESDIKEPKVGCTGNPECIARPFWTALEAQTRHFLHTTTLADILNGNLRMP